MEASAGLVAGSHKQNQLLVIRGGGGGSTGEGEGRLQENDGKVCQICADNIGFTLGGDLFVACNECAFPVCRPCYEYERKDGNRACPHCKTRYKRHKGSPRVEGDEEEDDVDDLENEFSFQGDKQQLIAEAMLHDHMKFGRGEQDSSRLTEDAMPLPLTDAEAPNGASEYHAICIPSNTAGGGGKRVHRLPYIESNGQSAPKETASYGYGTVAWKDRLDHWRSRKDKYQMVSMEDSHLSDEKAIDLEDSVLGPELPIMDEGRQPLSRKIPIASSLINPYRMVIVIRLVVLAFFFRYRLLSPVENAYALWLTSVICEIWFAMSWILDQLPKWLPVTRETYLDRLSLRYERDGEPSHLAAVDVYVSTVDPLKEPPLVTANTILSVLSVDYPVGKVSCYVSDDGASMLTFETLSETSEFARKWVPFCKRFNIEPRAPEMYFAQKIDYLKDKVQTTFVKERRAMKREYEEFKVQMNSLVSRAQKVPEEGWTMQDGTPWPGNNPRDHPGMIQVFLGHNGGHDSEGNELPRLVYISREKRPGFHHHKKAGAMNALVRVSAVLTNAPFVLNLECNHYINNSSALREAMCFMMDPATGNKVCYVQFPQRFDGIDKHDRYANHNTVFYDINMKGLDGVQGPIYVGTGCVFRRQALYGHSAPVGDKSHKLSYNPFRSLCCCCCKRKRNGGRSRIRRKRNVRVDPNVPNLNLEDIEGLEDEKSLVDQKEYELKYGQSPVFVASTLVQDGGVPDSSSAASLLREAIHVISCGYEDKTEWGKEIGWIYGSVAEDILTGLKMHSRGWRSIYCMPARPAFKGSAPINLSDRLNQVLRWALGSIEILLSRHCPIWYGHTGRLKWLQRLAYINATVYPLTCIPLVAYCTLPAVCLFTWKFIVPEVGSLTSLWFIALFISIIATGILEMRWSGVGIEEWWRSEQFWVIGGVSSHLFAVFQGIVKVVSGIDTSFTVIPKSSENEEELYAFKWTAVLIPPCTILIINMVALAAGLSDAINSGYASWGPLIGKVLFSCWVILHLYPFLKGMMGRQHRTPTIVIVWSILLASIFSLLWVRINPFLPKVVGPSLEECGINC